jgi:hypothetical protein
MTMTTLRRPLLEDLPLRGLSPQNPTVVCRRCSPTGATLPTPSRPAQRIGVPSDMMNQAGDQVIMQSLIAMVHKAQQVYMHESLIKLFQSED